ncbi:chromosome partitioning protein ParB [Caballeronia novacaledonica]|uniref:Chromosome partitioning protein ParB n=1 Tax=Caballeronia novacaledonica TaxID=1544861 RepID=A0AA37I6Y9_9BURK|nr:chromosome partitioning protein ParB [Caballeronia novacaledonica]GJH23704.1 chromosome partitioning protein ParB [Caballeronia novacaledonica]
MNTGMKAGRPSRDKKEATLASLKDEKDEVRVDFNLDRAEHIKLKVHAAKSGKTIAEVLREFVGTLSY